MPAMQNPPGVFTRHVRHHVRRSPMLAQAGVVLALSVALVACQAGPKARAAVSAAPAAAAEPAEAMTPVATPAAGPLSAAQQQALVAQHNVWRTRVGVPGLRWADDLARSSAQWAAQLGRRQCALQHSGRNDVGENLFWASPLENSDGSTELQAISPREVVDDWGSESNDYSYASNRCRTGQVCGHYTQLVWKATREVGCARQICGDRAQIWVCQYRPAGNYVGERPY